MYVCLIYINIYQTHIHTPQMERGRRRVATEKEVNGAEGGRGSKMAGERVGVEREHQEEEEEDE